MPRPVTVAITGGIGAGKSEALKAFARHGAATLSADAVVHALLRDDAEVQREILAELGLSVSDASPEERGRLAEVVFADRAKLDRLEAILHPRVVREQQAWLERVEAPLAAIEIPLLYETGGEDRFDAVVVVTAPPEVRAARKDLSRVGDREARLIPDEEKAVRADYAYVNDGSLDELDAFAADVVAALLERHAS